MVSPAGMTPSTGLTEYFMGAFVLNLNPTGTAVWFSSLSLANCPGITLEAIVDETRGRDRVRAKGGQSGARVGQSR